MKYVLMFCNTPELGAKVDPKDSETNYQEIFAWFDEHYSAGRIVDGGAELQPPTTATTVKANGDQPVVVDGPFIESKEVVGGFSIIDVPDLDAALAMAKSWPALKFPGVSVEVRPIVDHGEGS